MSYASVSKFDAKDARYASLRGRSVLVTGGAGFIGGHLAEALLALGCNVRIIDDLTSGHGGNVPADACWIRASILDDAALHESVTGCDCVFHHAAMVSVPVSVEDPIECVRVNIEGTQRVLAASAACGVRRVIFAGSAAAYGDTPIIPSHESHAPVSCSPYAASKVAGEQLMMSASRLGLSTVSLRYFNVFGPRQDPRSAYAAVISAFADRLARKLPVTIHGDGLQTRDFVSIENVVSANLLAATSERDLRGNIYNVGTGRRVTLLELYQIMSRILGSETLPVFSASRAGDVRDSLADISKARSELGYEVLVGLEEGLERMLNGVPAL